MQACTHRTVGMLTVLWNAALKACLPAALHSMKSALSRSPEQPLVTIAASRHAARLRDPGRIGSNSPNDQTSSST
jgi:hypothetical protein